MQRHHLKQLTGLRFVAAFAVLISHFHQRGVVTLTPELYDSLDGGRTAVTFFFVLSGFILAYNYSDLSSRQKRTTFFVNRFARIYPVVLLALTVAAIATVAAENDSTFLRDRYSITSDPPVWLSMSFVAQILALTSWLPSARLNQPFNSPAWSISVEFFFYAMFPIILILISKSKSTKIMFYGVIALALQWLLICVISLFAPPSAKSFLISQFPLTHLAEFFIGVIACRILTANYSKFSQPRLRLHLVQIVTLGAILLLSVYPPVDPMYFLLTPFFAVLIATASLPNSINLLVGNRVSVLLGEASYSLYMIHIPVLNLLEALEIKFIQLGWLLVLVFIGISIAVYKAFEVPLARKIKVKFSAQ